MRALAREQGRFVSRAGLRKVAGPSDGYYALIIVDSNGCPVSALTEWYRLRRQSGSPGTQRTYLGFLLPFFGYLLTHGFLLIFVMPRSSIGPGFPAPPLPISLTQLTTALL